MIPAGQITQRFLIWGVTAAAVVPRQASDRSGWSIGGRLSNPFRKLLLLLVAMNFVRMLLSTDEKHTFVAKTGDFLGIVEVTGMTFLCYCTAYVLQRGLANYFNIRPGQDLMLSLCAVAILSIMGVVLSRMVHPNFWSLKKIANAISGLPTVSILKSHNRFTTRETHGHGLIIGQLLLTVEYWHVAVQLSCAAGYAFDRHTLEPNGLDVLMQASRSSAFLADWTRILCHAIFLNQMDELHHSPVWYVPHPAAEAPQPPDDDEGLVEEAGGALVPRFRGNMSP